MLSERGLEEGVIFLLQIMYVLYTLKLWCLRNGWMYLAWSAHPGIPRQVEALLQCINFLMGYADPSFPPVLD